MIATGLCMMGGCFAQEVDGRSVDSYWPAEQVIIPPPPSGNIGIFEYAEVPAGVALEHCYVVTKQIVIEKFVSFFYVFQNGTLVYNAYTTRPYYTDRHLLRLNYKNANGGEVTVDWKGEIPPNTTYEYRANSTGSAYYDANGVCISTPQSLWKEDEAGSRLRIVDARMGPKGFIVTYGKWHYEWYVLPMKSPAQTTAIFDVVTDTLVEI